MSTENETEKLRADLAARDMLIEQLRQIATTDHETKGDFIHRVNALLARTPADVKDELARLREENAELKSAWQVDTVERKDAVLAAQEKQNDALRAQLADKDAELARLRKELDEAKSSRAREALQIALGPDADEIDALRAQLASAEARVKALEEQIRNEHR